MLLREPPSSSIVDRAVRSAARGLQAAKRHRPDPHDISNHRANNIPTEIQPRVRGGHFSSFDRLERGYQVQRDLLLLPTARPQLRTPLAILRARLAVLADRQLSRELKLTIDG